MSALSIFQSNLRETLKVLARGSFSSTSERDEILKALVEGAEKLKASEVIWMLFKPDRAIRNAGAAILKQRASLETLDSFVEHARGKPEAALRAASSLLFTLKIPGLAKRLAELAVSPNEEIRNSARSLAFSAPQSPALEALYWQMVDSGELSDRLNCLDRLAEFPVTERNLGRWQRLTRATEQGLRERALLVLSEHDAERNIDLLVEALPEVSYTSQQKLTEAIARVARGKGPDFADKILLLMASGESATRSAVIKIILGMENRPELIRRYLRFSKTLAGWARDRALESMKSFGEDLLDPALELLADPEADIRASALTVVGSFGDAKAVPALLPLLKDEDWWIRVSVAEILGQLKDSRGLPALIAALQDREARWAAVEALGRIGDPQALPALAQLLKDPQPEVRIEVLLALRHFNHPKVLEALQRVAKTDPNRSVRTRALEIAEEIVSNKQGLLEDAEGLRNAAFQTHIGEKEPLLHRLLVGTRNQNASDFHLSVGLPPMVRLASELRRVKGSPFTADQTASMLRQILSEAQWSRLEKEQQLDFCYFIPGAGRYRANVFVDQRGLNAVFRVIPEKPPTIADIGLPSHLAEIATYHQGLVLICGPAGSGKSTTMAALVNLFNETRHDHVITMEEPVEFVHPFKSCLINQREIGKHTGSYARALRAALREDPDVIVIGDLRDNETIAMALTAAETGHIVLATMNSTTAPKAVDGLIASFPTEQQAQIRTSLSDSLRFVLAQRLLPAREKGKLVADFEILKGTMSVAALIRDEKTFQIPSAMQIGRSEGMQTHDEALRELLRHQLITAETAYMAATSKAEFEGLVSEEFLESRSFV